MIVKLLTEHHLEFLSLKGGCVGSSKSTLVKMSNCWKSHAAAHYYGLFESALFQPCLNAYFDEPVFSTGLSVFSVTTQCSHSVYTLYSFQLQSTPLFLSFEG